MRLSWFTQPPNGGLSSYYQFDTRTRQFVRIRLELDRKTYEHDDGGPLIAYKEKRAVGFFPPDVSRSAEVAEPGWRIGRDGALIHNQEFVTVIPKSDFKVLDCEPSHVAGGSQFTAHYGNAITFDPILPAGITEEHLELIANEIFINCEKSQTHFLLDPSPAAPSPTFFEELLSCFGCGGRSAINAPPQPAYPSNETNRGQVETALKRFVTGIMGRDFSEVTIGSIRKQLAAQTAKLDRNASLTVLIDNGEIVLTRSVDEIRMRLKNIQTEIRNNQNDGADPQSGLSQEDQDILKTADEFCAKADRAIKDRRYGDLAALVKEAKTHVDSCETMLQAQRQAIGATAERAGEGGSGLTPDEALQEFRKPSSSGSEEEADSEGETETDSETEEVIEKSSQEANLRDISTRT